MGAGQQHQAKVLARYSSQFRYLEIADVEKANAYEIRDRIGKPAKDVLFESMPMLTPLAATIPNDALWASQWNLARINAPDGWDISTGSSGVVICILDTGCDLSHPDPPHQQSQMTGATEWKNRTSPTLRNW